MQEELISVIIPIYNAENYIKKCIECVIGQSYQNYELLLIDDGSKDKSYNICAEAEKIDSRIKLIRRVNGGAAAARNTGLDYAQGDYIVFIDADDVVSHNYLENLYRAAKEEDYDIVQCEMVTVKKEFELSKEECVEYDADSVLNISKIQALNGRIYKVSLWGKIYKSKLWKDLRIPEGEIYEDEAIYYRLIDIAEKIAVLSERLYFYVMSDNSVMRNSNEKKSEAFIDILITRIEYFQARQEWKLVAGSYERLCICLMLFYSARKNDKYNKNNINRIITLYNINFKKVMTFKEVTIKNKIMLTIFWLFPNFCSNWIVWLRNRGEG